LPSPRQPTVIRRIGACAAIALSVTASAATAQDTRIDSLTGQLARLTARLDSLEAGTCPIAPLTLPAWRSTGDAEADSLASAIGRLAQRLERVAGGQCPGLRAVETEPSGPLEALRAAADAAARAGGAGPDTTKTPQRVASGQPNLNSLNPEISVTGDVRAEVREGQNPPEDNFFLRELEFAFVATLDPVSKAKVFLTAEEDEVGIEEAYVYWAGLPLRSRGDIGKFRNEVGELNRVHLHALPEGEYPLVYRRFFGMEGLEGVGVSLYNPLPVSLAGGTHELWLQGTTVESVPIGGTSRQILLLARLKNFWQLSPAAYFQVGATALGANSSADSLTSRILGVDLRFTVRPPRTGTRRQFTLRTEGYLFHSTERGVTGNRYGMYADAQFRADRRWTFSTRFDWAEAPRGPADTEWAVVPTVTWRQSEFVYFRLEGRHEVGDVLGTRNQLGVQVVFSFGPHRHEEY